MSTAVIWRESCSCRLLRKANGNSTRFTTDNAVKLRSGLPYWPNIAQADIGQSSAQPLAGDAHCEVLVLGGGITGALVAHRLTQQGVNVLLLDERDFGHGSTAASTGLLQYEVDEHLVDLIDKVGEAAAVRAYRRGLEMIDEIETLVASLGDSCGFERRESLYFASSIWHRRRLKKEFECRRQFGFDVDFLSRQQLKSISAIRASAAILSRGDAQIDPFRLTRKLIEAATQQGLRAHPRTKVMHIEELAQNVVAKTETGTVTAGKVIYATGYATRPFLDGEESGSLHSTYAVVSQPLGEIVGWPQDMLLWETARPYFYARRTPDGRAMIGGEDTSYSTDHKRDGLVDRKIKKLVQRFERLFPGAEFTPEFAWAGTFAETKDGLAYIGQPPDRPRAYFALGYGGNGITYSMIAAKLLADLYTGTPNPDADVFRFGR